MNKIFVFLILSCLVITGQLTTTCNQCWNIGSTKCCDEREFQCDGSDCMTSSEYCRINGVDFRTIQKGCSYEPLCNKCFSVTTKDNFVTRVSHACGEEDSSIAELDYSTKICDRDLQPNGYQCPSCFTVGNTDGCESTGYVDCLGLEKECVDYSATVILSDGIPRDLSVKGCATTGLCQIAFIGIPGGKELKRAHMICTSAIPKE